MTGRSLEEELADARRLIEADDEAATELLRQLARRHPGSARVHFELGSAYDHFGREREAIPEYRRAMQQGLGGDDLTHAYLQLGSSLRNVGGVDEAVAVLREGARRYPDHRAMRVFLALALYSNGQCREALVELLELVSQSVGTPDMHEYDRALREYIRELATESDTPSR